MRQYLHGQHNLLMAIIWLVLYYFDVLLFAMPKDSGEAGSYSCDCSVSRWGGGAAHRAQVMAWAVVSMPAMKKMDSSLHSRTNGSGWPDPSRTRIRCAPIEQSSSSDLSPLDTCHIAIIIVTVACCFLPKEARCICR